MRSKGFFLLLILLLPTLIYFPGNTHASGGDYIIFRGQVAEMYIENATAPVKVRAVYYAANNIPQSINIDIPFTVTGYNYSYSSQITLLSGHEALISLPPMPAGRYTIEIYATAQGISSEHLRQDFAVSPAPLPYEIALSDDGTHLYFSSKVLNETGQIDPNITFRVELYNYQMHVGEVLIRTYNTTNMSIEIPASYRHGILIIEVYDKYGWRNGNGVDISQAVYAGPPLQYDFDYKLREPYASRSMWYAAAAFISIIIIFMIASRRYEADGGE